jgi:7-cyano-7-deazaguanine reductase
MACMGTIPDSPLGKATAYPEAYDASLLYAVERAPQRQALRVGERLPFHGEDRWTAWELTWLDARGVPAVAIARFAVPCESPRIVESKSVKLWLASLYRAQFASPQDVRELIVRDLSAATGAAVRVELDLPDAWSRLARVEPDCIDLDREAPASIPAFPDASLLRATGSAVHETLVTRTFRSVCPVTGQPDYACIAVGYEGAAIDRASLFAYLLGFRRHAGFHEHCIERVYVDLARRCAPRSLVVHARFTRRGGVDINPWRASDAALVPPATLGLRQ